MFFEVLFGILGALFWLFGIPLILSFIVLYLIKLLHENEFVTEKGVEESSKYVLSFIFVSWLIFYYWFWVN